eukprot:1395876-Pleurochrysis_carterae.AAC.1
MPLRPRWKIESDRLAKESVNTAYAALREMTAGSSSYAFLLERSLALMQQSKALQDANKPPEPPPKNPLLD